LVKSGLIHSFLTVCPDFLNIVITPFYYEDDAKKKLLHKGSDFFLYFHQSVETFSFCSHILFINRMLYLIIESGIAQIFSEGLGKMNFFMYVCKLLYHTCKNNGLF